jgi:hypothetical protein
MGRSVRQIRVYADTSVFGGTRDPEFSGPSGQFRLLLSAETLRELAGAPQEVQAVWQAVPAEHTEEVILGDDVHQLAMAYVDAHVLGQASWSDAVHVAAATVAAADLILSWNFRHIVNFNRIRGFNSVNVGWGYRAMTILSPMEIGDEDDEDL